MIPGEQLIPLATKHLSEGYKVILAQSLDTKGCIAFGTVYLGEGDDDIMEFVIGEGKVRELDLHKDRQTVIIPQGRMVAVGDKEYPGKAHLLNTIFRKAKEVAYDLTPCLLEWSYYDRPVGRLGHNEVWWEIR